MLNRVLRLSTSALLVGFMIALPAARADVYTWVDKSGSINVSNLAPPDGAQVTKVIHANPAEIAAREAAARDAARQAQLQALSERVHQLESEVQSAAPRPPPVDYRAPVPAPMVQYVPDPAPAMQYAAPSTSYGCDATQFDCGTWGYSGYYPANVIFLRAPAFRRQPPHREGHHYAAQRPMPAPGGMHRG